MATINKSALGKVSGSLGDITFRQRNGKNIVSLRSGSFTPGKDPQSIARRNKFAHVVQVAKTIYSIPELQEIWNQETPADKMAMNVIFQKNYPSLKPGELPQEVCLAPTAGFFIGNATVEFLAETITCTIPALKAASAPEKKCKLFSLVFLTNPSDTGLSKNALIKYSSDFKPISTTDPMSFGFTLSSLDVQTVKKYQDKKIFFILFTATDEEEIIGYSNTFIGETV